MSELVSSGKKKDYELYTKNKKLFKACVEACMDKTKQNDGSSIKIFQSFMGEFLSENPQSSIDEFFSEFRSEGKTLLHIAASGGNKDIIELALNECKDVKTIINLQDNNGHTSFINATISESLDIMKLLSNKADINISNKDNATALHFAAGDGSLERVKFLIENNANIDILSSNGGTPLHWAAQGQHGNYEVISFLANKCSNVDAINSDGITPILIAAASGKDDIVKILVDANADLGNIYTGNLTLLHICCENGLYNSAEAIVKKSIGIKCIDIKTGDGLLPIHLAAMANHTNIVKLLLPLSNHLDDIKNKTFDEIMNDSKILLEKWEAEHLNNKNNNVDNTNNLLSTTNNDKSYEEILEKNRNNEINEIEASKLKDEGNKFFQEKNYENAIKSYSAALKLHYNNKYIWSNRSACHLAIKDYKNALHDAEICRRLDPQWIKGCYRLASARLALGLYEDAALAAFEGCKIDETSEDLKLLMQKCIKKGQQAHQETTSQVKDTNR